MLMSGAKSSSTSSRYFTQEGLLPPLALSAMCPSNQTTDTMPYTESPHGRSIPVVYTNDPNSIYRWLSNNLPIEGCTMGFDTEVSFYFVCLFGSYWNQERGAPF
jgi:hypothetical protein